MLDPGIQTVLGSALCPPSGMRVGQAVATTYSLNLTALLLAPLTFALAEPESADAADADPLRLLDAVERHIDHTSVFVQAGGLSVPTSHSRIHTFLEDSVVQVEPPDPQGLFHPKIWAVRFTDDDGGHHHRLLIGSRNLTLDDSWDTLLVLDEAPDGHIEGEPAADFLAALPAMALVEMPSDRHTAVLDLASTVGAVRFAAPEPFRGGSLLPLGIPRCPSGWPFPDPSRIRRTLAISPFLTPGALHRLHGGEDPVLVSRPEQLDLLAAHVEGWACRVLNDGMVDVAAPEGAAEVTTEASLTKSGLHAKTAVVDVVGPRARSLVVTGSANLTDAAWHRNVEFNAVLEGRTDEVGVAAILSGSPGGVGLEQVLLTYEPAEPAPDQEQQIANSYELEAFHRRIAASLPRVTVTAVGEDLVEARLDVDMPPVPEGSTTTVRLLSMPADARPLADTVTWRLSPKNVTPFLVVSSSVGTGPSRVDRHCMVLLLLSGDLKDRRQICREELLDSEQAVLRYLALLLGMDDSSAAPLDRTTDLMERLETPDGADSPERRWDAVVLFEPLLRASTGDVKGLASVAGQVAKLRASDRIRALIPEEFEQMWDTILGVVAPDLFSATEQGQA